MTPETTDEEKTSNELESFPSARFLVRLYSFGAMLALIISFMLNLDSTQITMSLFVSWILTSGALGISIFVNNPMQEDSDEF